MASNDPVAQLRRLVECPVCFERSSDQRVLPCLHSFCKDCLNSHMIEQGRSGEFPCPLCKTKFPVPRELASGFKHNFFHAGICNIVSNYDSMNKMHCSVHGDRLLEIYCEQCKVAICSRCATSRHNQHKLKDLDVAAKDAIEVMRDLLKPWRDVTQHWEMLRDKRQQVAQSYAQQQNACKNEIKRVYSDFLAEITRQVRVNEEKAIAELEKQVEAARKQAEGACDEAELNRAKFARVYDYVNNVLESCHDAEKLQQFNEIKSLLENLNIDQIQKRVEKSAFEIQPATIEVPNVAVNIMKKMEDENISSNFLENFASVVAVSSKSPVHRVTPQLTVKHVQLERRFSSLLERRFSSRLERRFGSRLAPRLSSQLERVFSTLLEGERRGSCNGLAVGDGVVVVTDMKNHDVNVFNRNNLTFKFTLNTAQHQLQNPLDVTCNRLGEIFITHRGIQGVVKYNARGQQVKVYPGVYKGEGYITCHTDQLIVADTQGGRVLYTDFDCEVHHEIDARSLGLSEFSPYYICVDENTGHVVVSQYYPPRVYVIDPTQPAVIHTFSDGLGVPWGVCVDQFGHILLADSVWCNQCIHLLTPARAHVITTKGDVDWPTAICPSGPGKVYVLERDGDVKEFSYLDI